MARNAYGFETASLIDAGGPHTVSPLASPFAAGIDGDLSTLLPPEPARRFRLLRDAVADINAIGHGLAARLIDLTETGQRARLRLAQITAQRVGEGHPEFIAQTAALANAQEELDRLNLRIASHEAVAGPRRALLAKVTDWLRSNAAGHEFAEVELAEAPKLLKGETQATATDRLRRRLRELSADEHRVRSAPYPSAHAKAVAANYIDTLAEAAVPYVSNAIEHGGPLIIGNTVEPPIVFAVKWSEFEVETVAGKGIARPAQTDLLGLMAYLFRDQMVARINALVDEESDDKAALTTEQRREQMATVVADKQHVEREEAYLIWQAFAAGTVIEPRPDADPAAFLGVAVVEARARPAPFDHADAFAVARHATATAAEGISTEPGSPS